MIEKDIKGRKFGRWTALQKVGRDKWRNSIWLFKCECGNQKEVKKHSVLRGDSLSCGCAGNSGQYKTTHGMNGTRFYNIWSLIKSRTKNTNDMRYAGRGIKCLWKTLEEFRDDMYPSYLAHVAAFGESDTSIDRYPDNNGHYCKENCRWATNKEQAQNRRSNVAVIYEGKRRTLKEMSEIFGMPYKKVHNRVYKQLWPISKALLVG